MASTYALQEEALWVQAEPTLCWGLSSARRPVARATSSKAGMVTTQDTRGKDPMGSCVWCPPLVKSHEMQSMNKK